MDLDCMSSGGREGMEGGGLRSPGFGNDLQGHGHSQGGGFGVAGQGQGVGGMSGGRPSGQGSQITSSTPANDIVPGVTKGCRSSW